MSILNIFKRKKQSKPEKDISEPIITVLKLMQDEPGRFDLTSKKVKDTSFTRFGIRDRKLDYVISWLEHDDVIWTMPCIGFTTDESNALHQEYRRIHKSRRDAWAKARHEAHRNVALRVYEDDINEMYMDDVLGPCLTQMIVEHLQDKEASNISVTIHD